MDAALICLLEQRVHWEWLTLKRSPSAEFERLVKVYIVVSDFGGPGTAFVQTDLDSGAPEANNALLKQFALQPNVQIRLPSRCTATW
jgi:hypothetical protein